MSFSFLLAAEKLHFLNAKNIHFLNGVDTCKNFWKKKGCNKKNVKKNYIEDFVLSYAREQLTDENIALIASTVSDISKRENNTPVLSNIKKKLKENAAAIENLLNAIENGEHIELLSERIT